MLRNIRSRTRAPRYFALLGALACPAWVFGETTFGTPISIPVKLECSGSTTKKVDLPANTRQVAIIAYNTGKKGTCTISPVIDWATCDLHGNPGEAVSQIFPPPTKKNRTVTVKCGEGKGGCEGIVRIVPLAGAGESAGPLTLLPGDAADNVTAKCGDSDLLVLTHFGSADPQALTIEVENLGDCDVLVKNDQSQTVAKASKGKKGSDGPTDVTLIAASRIRVSCSAGNDKDKDKSCKAAVKVLLSMKKKTP